jgi:hypothetical protein
LGPSSNGNGNGRELWKHSTVALTAVLIALCSSWFAFGRDSITQSEVQNLINGNSPYTVDRAGINARLESLEARQVVDDGHYQALDSKLSDLLVQVARIQQQLSAGAR